MKVYRTVKSSMKRPIDNLVKLPIKETEEQIPMISEFIKVTIFLNLNPFLHFHMVLRTPSFLANIKDRSKIREINGMVDGFLQKKNPQFERVMTVKKKKMKIDFNGLFEHTTH